MVCYGFYMYQVNTQILIPHYIKENYSYHSLTAVQSFKVAVSQFNEILNFASSFIFQQWYFIQACSSMPSLWPLSHVWFLRKKFSLQFTIFSVHKRTVQSYFSTSVGKMLLCLKRVDLLLDSVDSSHRYFMYYFPDTVI